MKQSIQQQLTHLQEILAQSQGLYSDKPTISSPDDSKQEQKKAISKSRDKINYAQNIYDVCNFLFALQQQVHTISLSLHNQEQVQGRYEATFQNITDCAKQLGYDLAEMQLIQSEQKYLIQKQESDFHDIHMQSRKEKLELERKTLQLTQHISETNEKQQEFELKDQNNKLTIDNLTKQLIESQARVKSQNDIIQLLKKSVTEKSEKYQALAKEFLQTSHEEKSADTRQSKIQISKLKEEIQTLKAESTQKDVMINCIGQDAEEKDKEIEQLNLKIEQLTEQMTYMQTEIQEFDKLKKLNSENIMKQAKLNAGHSSTQYLMKDPLDNDTEQYKDLLTIVQEQQEEIQQLRKRLQGTDFLGKSSIIQRDSEMFRGRRTNSTLPNSSNLLFTDRQKSFERISESVKNDLMQLLEIGKDQNIVEPEVCYQIQSAVSVLQTRNSSFNAPNQPMYPSAENSHPHSINSSADNLNNISLLDERKSSSLSRIERPVLEKLDSMNLQLKVSTTSTLYNDEKEFAIKPIQIKSTDSDLNAHRQQETHFADRKQNSVVHVANDLEISEETNSQGQQLLFQANQSQQYIQENLDTCNIDNKKLQQHLELEIKEIQDDDDDLNQVIEELKQSLAEKEEKIKELQHLLEGKCQLMHQELDELNECKQKIETSQKQIHLLKNELYELKQEYQKSQEATTNVCDLEYQQLLKQLKCLQSDHQQLYIEYTQLKQEYQCLAKHDQHTFEQDITQNNHCKDLFYEITQQKVVQTEEINNIFLKILETLKQVSQLNFPQQDDQSIVNIIRSSLNIIYEQLSEYNDIKTEFNSLVCGGFADKIKQCQQ